MGWKGSIYFAKKEEKIFATSQIYLLHIISDISDENSETIYIYDIDIVIVMHKI